MVTISTRPVSPPSIFMSLRPHCQSQHLASQLNYLKYFLKDNILSFATFRPDKELHKTYKNIIRSISTVDKFVVFSQSDFSESNLINIVHNKSTLCSPLTFSAFKNGVSVPLGRILSPNNGLSSYFNFWMLYIQQEITDFCRCCCKKSGIISPTHRRAIRNWQKLKKLKFLSRQLQLI